MMIFVHVFVCDFFQHKLGISLESIHHLSLLVACETKQINILLRNHPICICTCNVRFRFRVPKTVSVHSICALPEQRRRLSNSFPTYSASVPPPALRASTHRRHYSSFLVSRKLRHLRWKRGVSAEERRLCRQLASGLTSAQLIYQIWAM